MRLIRFVKRIFRRGVDTVQDSSVDTTASLTPSGFPLILCGPEYDDATKIMGSWLHDVSIPATVQSFFAIGPDITRESLADLLLKTRGRRGIKIFVGHGSDDVLLGPHYADCTRQVVDGREFSVIYDAALLGTGPSALFAFCCKSGKRLGERFGDLPGRSFLGYVENIGYDLTNDECRNVWKNIIQLISKDIIADGRIDQAHEASLQALYDDAIEYFLIGAGRNNDRNVETLILLSRHKDHLRRYGGATDVSNV